MTNRADKWSRAYEVLCRRAAALLRRRGVVAVDVGVKVRRGEYEDVPAIRIHVVRKLTGGMLRRHRAFPEFIDGVPTDVLERRYAPTACGAGGLLRRVRRDPLVGGVAIGAAPSFALGTLCFAVVDASGTVHGLTAGHVLNAEGSYVRQPHSSSRVVGRTKSVVIDGAVDAGLFAPVGAASFAPGVFGRAAIGKPRAVSASELPLKVVVYGACSGARSGVVDSLTARVRVPYGDRTVTFVDVMHVAGVDGRPISAPGDSGAPVVGRNDGAALGMLFAGEPAGEGDFAIAAPMARILERLSVDQH